MNIKKDQAKIIVIDKVQVRETYQEREREWISWWVWSYAEQRRWKEKIYSGGITVPETRQV